MFDGISGSGGERELLFFFFLHFRSRGWRLENLPSLKAHYENRWTLFPHCNTNGHKHTPPSQLAATSR